MLNKYLFAAFALLFALSASAQERFSSPLPKVKHLQAVPYEKTGPALELYTPEIENPNAIMDAASDRNAEEVVGITRWDAQGYGCVPSRVYYKPNGDPVATWTHATDLAEAFPERGTAYSSRSGGAWSPVAARIESARTGFPSAGILSDGTEVVVAHNTVTAPYRLMFLRRAAGQSAWTESFLETPAGVGCLWPHLVVGGQDGKTVHLIAITTPTANTGVVYQGINGHILYWRSTDGGLTWDKKAQIIPGLDNTKYTVHGADEYTLDANGGTVGIAAFPAWNDIVVFKSYDNGDSWESIVARDFPDALENYAGADGQTYTVDDVGTPDPDAPDSLAIFNSDGSGNMLIDDNGEVHLFFGRMYYADTDPAAGTSYYPGINGLAHWKESFGTDTYQVITGALDYDGDGSLGVSAIDEIAPYYISLSGMPSSGSDANGTIYVGYSALHELYPAPNGQFFRHVYVLKSADFGESWGEPLDLIADPFISDTVLIPFVESVYPMLPRHIGSNVGLVYQQDYDPGIHLLGPTAAGNHPYVDNSLLWIEVNPLLIPGISGTFSPGTPNASLALNISPNPATETATLSAMLSGTGDVTVEVFDIMGSRVFLSSAPSAEGHQSLALPVQNFIAGTYTVRVTEGKAFGITKLVVAK